MPFGVLCYVSVTKLLPSPLERKLLPQSFLIGLSFRRIEFQHALTLRMLVRLREHSA